MKKILSTVRLNHDRRIVMALSEIKEIIEVMRKKGEEDERRISELTFTCGRLRSSAKHRSVSFMKF